MLRPEAKELLAHSDHIVHAGDIGSLALLNELRSIAPTSVVRGNNDTEPWALELPAAPLVELGGLCIYIVHDRATLQVRPAPAGAKVIVTGHSHKPALEAAEGRLMINPGSAGPRRFKLPVALAELRIDGRMVSARTLDLVSRRALGERSITVG